MSRAPDPARPRRNRARAELAFETYVRLGAKRSLLQVQLELHRHGIRVSLRTIERWSSAGSWSRRLAAIEHAAGADLDRRLADDRVERLLDQAELGRALQRKAREMLDAARPDGIKLELAVKFAIEGSALERTTLDAAMDARDRAYHAGPAELRRKLREVNSILAELDDADSTLSG